MIAMLILRCELRKGLLSILNMKNVRRNAMKVLYKDSRYIITGAPISQNAIAEARYKFLEKIGNGYHLELHVGPKALSDMLMEVGIKTVPVHFTNEKVQGMLIVPDGTLKPDEWMVGQSSERVREIQ
jgi:hypothetical protein